MEKIYLENFDVIGISVRTTNNNGQSAKDIGELWGKFMSENYIDKIPNKVDTSIYSIYTDYEGDYTQPYTTILGCKVENLKTIPEGMVAKTISSGGYTKFVAKGDLSKSAVFVEWTRIWEMDLPRLYSADFEVYGEKAQNPNDAEVDIFIATR
ncbi:MAG: GyrI-like domain-containing protein [Bacteroidetes bacterium]|nr:GyrI-like domain-containing protein [Bacteroidota bacterium]MBU1115297.1 GyrI-like domain-containing protein [Bacteroidota bacterium]MBU1800147.1 GyrI-like domain-containing protein [Bacteroidota bacterium]